MKKISITVTAFALTWILGASVVNAANFFNDFEVDTNGWVDYGGATIAREMSGYNGVTSATGSYHAVLTEGDTVVGGAYNNKKLGPFTRWGGYENSFPVNGYITKVDVYLDTTQANGEDKRFDFSSAINNPSGDHRRDFIFAVGTVAGESGKWAVSVSNNAPGWPANPARNPLFITESGWYTLQHTFQDNGSGVLQVVMEVLDQSNNQLASWTLSDAGDVIGSTVGGNRYGWFATNDFNELPIDNSEKVEVSVDNEAPDVSINSPEDESTVSGMVSIVGTIEDESPHHYWLVVQDNNGNKVAGPGVVNETNSLVEEELMVWDTTQVADGMYTIKLEARDSYDNKDDGSVAWHKVYVNNTPDNKDECKDGGWMNFYTPEFKNQGDCVSYLQSNKKAKGNKNK